jgi:hypothetical protein
MFGLKKYHLAALLLEDLEPFRTKRSLIRSVVNKLVKYPAWKNAAPGVDVMITIFGDFRQCSAKKLALFSKTNVMIFLNLALFWVKNANFFADFSAKIF